MKSKYLPSFAGLLIIGTLLAASGSNAAASIASSASSAHAAGIEGILNFAPVTIAVPKHINLEGVDLAIELEQLSFAVVNKQGRAN